MCTYTEYACIYLLIICVVCVCDLVISIEEDERKKKGSFVTGLE
jgi:hypothetical protein